MVFILSSMLFKYTPMIRSYASNKEIYQNKYDLEYFSASFKELNYFYKVNLKNLILNKILAFIDHILNFPICDYYSFNDLDKAKNICARII